MRKFIATLILIFGISFVALPFIPIGCSDVSASADVVSGSRFDSNPVIYYNRGLSLVSGGNTVDFPDVYYIPFDYALGGLNVVGGYHYVYIPFQVLLTDNGFLQFKFPYYSLIDGIVFDGTYSSILFQLNGQYNVNQSTNFTSYSSQSDSILQTHVYIDTYTVTVFYSRSSASVSPYPIISPNANANISEFVNAVEVRYYRTYVDIVYLLPRVVSNNVLLQDSSDFVRVRIEDNVNYDGYFPLGTRPVSTDILLSSFSFPVEFLNMSSIYNDGYDKGYDVGFGEGVEAGRENAYDQGYTDGVSASLSDVTPWDILVQQVDAFFNLSLFGSSVTFGTVLSIGFGMLLMGIAIKIFMGG